MILEGVYQKIEEQPNEQQQQIIQQNNQTNTIFQQSNLLPIMSDMLFIPPPINDSSKYLDQLENQFLLSMTKNEANLDYITLFGQKRSINLMSKKLPQPLFIDSSVKQRLKKVIRSLYEKMIQNLKYCAGEMPLNYSSPLPKIMQRSHEFMLLCQQLQVAQTKQLIWKMMQQQTIKMNQKSQQIEQFVGGMVQYCKEEEQKNTNF